MAVTTKKKSGGGQTTVKTKAPSPAPTPAPSTVKTKAPTSGPSRASSPTVAPAAPTYAPTTPKPVVQHGPVNWGGVTQASPSKASSPVVAPAAPTYNPAPVSQSRTAGYVPATGSTMQPKPVVQQGPFDWGSLSESPTGDILQRGPADWSGVELATQPAPSPSIMPTWLQSIQVPDYIRELIRYYGPDEARRQIEAQDNWRPRVIDVNTGRDNSHVRAINQAPLYQGQAWDGTDLERMTAEAYRQYESRKRRPNAGRTGAIDITYQTAPAPVVDPEGGLIYPPGYDTNGDGYADYWPQYASDGYTPWDDWGRGGWGGGSGWGNSDWEQEPQDWFVGMQNWRF